MDKFKTIPKEEWEELTKIPDTTKEQMEELANLCGISENFDPIGNDMHSHKLLEAVVKRKDCKLFYDDGPDEYFIYQFGPRDTPAVGNRQSLNECIFEAAYNLYFPEEE